MIASLLTLAGGVFLFASFMGVGLTKSGFEQSKGIGFFMIIFTLGNVVAACYLLVDGATR